MQYISNFIKNHKTAFAFVALILMLGIIGASIYFALGGNFSGGDESGGENIDQVYDPISHQTYQNIDQEPEGDALSGPVYMGFGPLLDLIGEDAYFRFVEQADEFSSENFPNVDYISLYEDSLAISENGEIGFTIYFDSAEPADVTMNNLATKVDFIP